jgi:hypothetical protein
MREFPEPFTASRWRRSTHHEARCGAPATLRSLELGCPVNAECGHLHSPRHHSNSPELPFGARTEEPAKLQRVSSVARCVDLSPRAGRRILEPARSRDPRTIFPLAPQRGERAGVRGHQFRVLAHAVAATSFERSLTAGLWAPSFCVQGEGFNSGARASLAAQASGRFKRTAAEPRGGLPNRSVDAGSNGANRTQGACAETESQVTISGLCASNCRKPAAFAVATTRFAANDTSGIQLSGRCCVAMRVTRTRL